MSVGRYMMDGAALYCARRMPRGLWARRARLAICKVLESVAPGTETVAILKRVDEAYPFGERAHAPYRAWLSERRQLIADLDPVAKSAEEWGAIEVAADMEQEGRPAAEVQALLDEQAPNRHARPCPTCARPKGKPCREPAQRLNMFQPGGVQLLEEFVDRLIPHAARCQP